MLSSATARKGNFFLPIYTSARYIVQRSSPWSVWPADLALVSASEVGEAADEGRVGVRGRLGPRVVAAVVRERVVLVRPADDGARVHVGVGRAGVEVALEPLLAPDVGRVAGHRRQGRRPVVDPLRPPRAEVHHVRHALGVHAQDVVHLFLGEGPEGPGGDGEAPAGEGVLGDGHVLGVGGEQEAGRGHVLQVGVAGLVHQAAGRVPRRGGRRAGQDPAEEVLGLLPERLQRLVPVHQSSLHARVQQCGIQQMSMPQHLTCSTLVRAQTQLMASVVSPCYVPVTGARALRRACCPS
jgi:hypothetical protein